MLECKNGVSKLSIQIDIGESLERCPSVDDLLRRGNYLLFKQALTAI